MHPAYSESMIPNGPEFVFTVTECEVGGTPLKLGFIAYRPSRALQLISGQPLGASEEVPAALVEVVDVEHELGAVPADWEDEEPADDSWRVPHLRFIREWCGYATTDPAIAILADDRTGIRSEAPHERCS